MKKRTWLISTILIVIILALGFVFFRNNENGREIITVQTRDVIDEVKISGTVAADVRADLGFEVTGRTDRILVSEGDSVSADDVLIQLSLGTLLAELRAAEADVVIKAAEASNVTTNLTAIENEQNALVESAYRTLLSEGLELKHQSDTSALTPPNISGRYTGPEGQYKIQVRRAASQDTYELLTFGLENTGPITLKENQAIPLGSYGLFIDFVEDVSEYNQTTWFLDIPNTDSSVYIENRNAHETALRTRDRTLEEARNELATNSTSSSIADAELDRARAEVARIQADIERRQLTAPFDGIVTKIDVDLGEIVNANEVVASLIAPDTFGIDIDLPEIDSVKVFPEDMATVVFDAFDDETFTATVDRVDTTESIVDGVSVYEARLLLDTPDPRITSGMTADATIITDSRATVLAIPLRAISTNDTGELIVIRPRSEGTYEHVITTGLQGSDGFVEVTSGLSEGDRIIVPRP